MKNLSKVLALVLVVAMVFSLAVSAGAAVSFKDDASINYDEAVQLLAALDVINGYDTDGDGKGDTFKPGNAITRAELTVMLSYLVANEDSEYGLYNDITKLNKDYKSLCTFADSKDHYAAGFIAFCYGNGYISGRAADKFDPAGNVTVAEAAVMLLRVMGYDAAKEEFGTSANTVKGYNLQLTARNAGLLDGLDNVDFFAPATREQVAQLFLNALDGNVVSYTVAGVRYFETIATYINNNFVGNMYKTLVNECFQHVVKKETTNEFGFAGHQWVTYANWTTTTHPVTNVVSYSWTGGSIALTDVVVDDTVMATYTGGTSYAKIASDLGLTSATNTVPCVVYVNGALVDNTTTVTGGNFQGLPGVGTTSAGSLNAIYTAGVQRGALDDNCSLSIVRDYDRSVGGTYYKLMYNFEFVGVVKSVAQITNPADTRYGQYAYTFEYYNNTVAGQPNTSTDVVYGAKDAYAKNVYYIVVPNESTINSGSNYPNVSEYSAFLSVVPAKVYAPFTATKGSNVTFMSSYYVANGTETYYVSANIKDFTNGYAGYGKAIGLIFNTAGYVAGYSKLASAADETGYVYVNSVEFSETLTAGASWINQFDYTWSAQAKAQVYFPAVGGNSSYSVIDLAIDNVAKTVAIATANWGDFTADAYGNAGDTYVKQNAISLKGRQTNAFYDVYGAEYNWTNNASNIRVYDKWFDGWYVYTKFANGTYSLVPVATDKVVAAGTQNPNVTINNTTAATLASTTDFTTYTMDLNTMTASAVTVTGYKNFVTALKQTFGGQTLDTYVTASGAVAYSMPKTGIVGGEYEVNDYGIVTAIDEFKTVRAESKYDYTLFMGEADYTYGAGTAYQFLVAGGAEVLYLHKDVVALNNAGALAATGIADVAAYLDRYDHTNVNNPFAWKLTLVNGVVTQVAPIALTRYEVASVDSNGWFKLKSVDAISYNAYDVPTWTAGAAVNGGLAENYNTANVWNIANGTADVPAKGDLVYVVGDYVATWCYTPGAGVTSSNPNWNVNNGSLVFPWWN